MRQFIDRHGLTIIFAVGIAVCLGVGWALEHKAFTPASPPGQAFAVVFVQDKSASLSLTATVNPDSPWHDRLTVRVKGAPVRRDHWLLIIGCPPGSANSPHPGTLVSEPAAQAPAPASSVTVYSGAGPSRTVKLGCFSRVSSNSLNQSNTPGYASIGSVTLPALETDQTIQGAASTPVLYAERPYAEPPYAEARASAGPVHLVQVFHGAPPAGAAFSTYYLPSSVQTKETLTDVNLAGYQIESIFPDPQISPGKGSPGQGVTDDYTWTGLSSLSPTMMLSNLAGQQTVSHYTFIAGVLLGIAGGAAASFLEHLWPDLFPQRKRKEKNGLPAREETLSTEPALAHASPHSNAP